MNELIDLVTAVSGLIISIAMLIKATMDSLSFPWVVPVFCG